ncbi:MULTISPECIES: hypothetical protein [Rhodococcus]|uniref:hypothetical protein n=1 Tax=Rhodococcus TaxID=1827 RepID=UPI00193B7E63|nr:MULTISPECIES: hypothetical protein [Rhodococcus]QRI76268.1 hypothetical protein JQ505_00085 [Rhodococcus aetherivorans]QSE59679.1 hypothetical protein JYA75_01200 [Rhodococcus sp. PSBB066]
MSASDIPGENNQSKEINVSAKNPARLMIESYLGMLTGDKIEPGNDALTAKVQAKFDAWCTDHGLNRDDELETSAEMAGLTVNEYAWLLDYFVSDGEADDVMQADLNIIYWICSAAAAYGSREAA